MMRVRLFSFLVALLGLGLQPCIGQFDDITASHWIEGFTGTLGQGMSLVDFNLDGWDDLTVTNALGEVHFYTGGPDGFQPIDLGIADPTGLPMGVAWIDIDNDGDRDFFIAAGGPYSSTIPTQSEVWINEGGTFVQETDQRGWGMTAEHNAYSMAWSDFDLDRDLDVMISVYAMPVVDRWMHENILLRNDGPSFADVSQSAGIAEGFQPSFQGIWMDENQDGLPDLMVVNDSGLQSDSLGFDPNLFYRNQGDGTFLETASSLNLDAVMSSMTVTAGDPDHDGDEEVFVTNQVNVNGFLPLDHAELFDKQSDGTYLWAATDWGVAVDQWGWGAVWIDYDADGWEDLVVATTNFVWAQTPAPNVLLRSPGPGLASGAPFIDASADLDQPGRDVICWVQGDFDRDGWPDLVGIGLDQHVQMLHNQPNSANAQHHWITVDLCGTHSNLEAIGSRVVVHAAGQSQTRYRRSGEGLYAQHSTTQFLGLGDAAVADSVEVFWPMGGRSVYHDVLADSAYRWVEAEDEIAPLLPTGTLTAGDSVWVAVSTPPGATGISWPDGSSGDSIFVPAAAPLTYSAEWFGGLFSVEGAVDWSLADVEFPGCTNPLGDNYDPAHTLEDGSCTFNSLCGAGTSWSTVTGRCEILCPEDVSGDGLINASDILMLLAKYGDPCTY